jgi:ABC-type antimicrobial peptide transport system permease subunit
MEVVGLVRDAKYASVREAAPPTLYVPFRQSPRPAATIEVRTEGAPLALVGSIREAVKEVDPNLPIASVTTQTANIEGRFVRERLFAQAYTVFGAIALLLASIGLFGLMSYNVGRRTSEMGIRMALGAQRFDVIQLVMRESLVLVVAGVVAGATIAIASTRFIEPMLFSVAARDPSTFASAAAVMLLVSAIAAYLPARRASRVDPVIALRYD